MEPTITFLNKLLDYSADRHKVLANNLANVNTPGYVRQDMRFEDTLKSALEKRDNEAIGKVETELYKDRTQPFRPDGNNVSTQTEMAQLLENQLLYRTAVKAMGSKLQTLRKAIGGAGGGK